jgi:hypothetical protein
MCGAGKKKDIEGRIGQIKAETNETTSDYDCEKPQERLAKFRSRTMRTAAAREHTGDTLCCLFQ